MKKVSKSNLMLQQFSILKSSIDFIPLKDLNKKNNIDIPIYIDYNINIIEENNKTLYRIIIEIKGNDEDNPVEGYKFEVVAGALFEFKEDIEKPELDKYILYSALPMTLSMARGYLASMTSYGLYGKYLIPAIDVNSIIKNEEDEE